MVYIALLEGLMWCNNIVDMRKLKTTFESLGFTNVTTYINSGNVLFKDSLKEEKN